MRSVKVRSGSKGTFLVGYTPKSGGRITVRASHAASAEVGAARATVRRVDVIVPHASPGSHSSSVRWLQRKLAYTNTFFHQPPRLDIQDPDPGFFGRHDFVISSDVLEHVVPPVATAFVNLHRLLKPGGVLAFTVPYAPEGETREHFPELHAFRIEGEGRNRRLLNTTRDGRSQAFGDLCFQARGAGRSLESRQQTCPTFQTMLV